MVSETHNLFLSALSRRSRQFLIASSESVKLTPGTVLYGPSEIPAYAYFLLSGMASLVISTNNGESVAIGIIGREGIIGNMCLLGSAPIPITCTIELNAVALRIGLSDLRAAFEFSEEIRRCILETIQYEILCIGQIAGCNLLHRVEQRMARFLLMVQDRTDLELLPFTQDELAKLLGVSRTTVTEIARRLQSDGSIEYSRGRIRIVDHEALGELACECYRRTSARSPASNPLTVADCI
jgi:CRP-like cAMP-binding protein